MLAVFKTGGKQYSVKSGQVLKVEKLNGNKGDSISFDKGCFIGQEVTSRMYRKGKAKKRVFSFQSKKTLETIKISNNLFRNT